MVKGHIQAASAPRVVQFGNQKSQVRDALFD